MTSRCAPSVPFDGFTCFPKEALQDMTRELKRRLPPSAAELPVNVSKPELWKNLRATFDTMCGADEACWTDRLNMSREFVKPPLPVRREKYLTSDEVKNLLMQHATPGFWFLGVYPLDFGSVKLGRCIGKLMCSLNIRQLGRKGCHSFGIVINTHPDGKPGEHWIALFCGIDPARPNYGAYFYDSYGDKWPAPVGEYMARLERQVGDPRFKRHYNTYPHQRASGECGMFCVEFIIHMASGTPFEEYVSKKGINDRSMAQQRSVRFRPAVAVGMAAVTEHQGT